MTYGEQIKKGRETQHLTQEQLAEALGVSRQAVSKWEMDLSRPTREKLERLSQVLELPPGTWEAIDAEAAEAERPPDRSRPWRIAAIALGALCLILAASLVAVLRRQARPAPSIPPEEDASAGLAQPDGAPDLTEVLPETLSLTVTHDFDFGDVPTGEYDAALVPYLDDPETAADHILWEDTFPDGARVALVDACADWDTFRTLYHLYIVYDLPGDAAGWKILYRIAEDLPEPWQAHPEAERFTNVLGRDGVKLTMLDPHTGSWDSAYLSQRPDGVPCLMGSTWNMGQEADLDDDGQLEIVYFDGYAPSWEIVDTVAGEEGAFHYSLSAVWDLEGTLGFEPDRGGFVVTGSDGEASWRYVLRDGALVRQPLTGFTAADWPDVAGTEAVFVTEEGLSDERGPDEVLGDRRITHRQQAYLALQELYDLTGLKVEKCYYSASEHGVHFSLLPDGTNGRNFFSAWYGEDHGGSGIPHLDLTWRELGSDWSPLSLAEAVRPGPSVAWEDTLRWYYDRLDVFRTGEAATETEGEFPDHRNLYLENGDLFVGYFQESALGPALVSLTGPYPDGEVNH